MNPEESKDEHNTEDTIQRTATNSNNRTGEEDQLNPPDDDLIHRGTGNRSAKGTTKIGGQPGSGKQQENNV